MTMTTPQAIEYVQSHYTLWSESVSLAREAVEVLLNDARLMQTTRELINGEIDIEVEEPCHV